MHKQLKKYLPFIFLFLLLFPIAEKALHALEHRSNRHCTITDKHFHQQEHSCSICDFTVTDSNGLPETDIAFINSSQEFLFQPFTQSVNIPFAFSNLPSRAPPTV